MFNGDVLTEIDLNAVLALHRSRKAKATIVLTPVENPTAYGLVETAPDGAVRRFLEKPKPDEITTNNINAGIYILEPDTFDRIPKDTPYSIERSYFPSLVERGEAFVAYVYQGYWIDIGTPEKYTQVHRDIMSGAFSAAPFAGAKDAVIAEGAKIEDGAIVQGPCFIDEGTVVRPGARVEPYSVIGRECHIEEGAVVRGSIVWSGSWIGREAVLDRAIVGRNAHVGRNATVSPGRILGDKSVTHRLHAGLSDMSEIVPGIFKAYDVRGLYPSEIHEMVAHEIGGAYVTYLNAKRIGVSRDMRVSSPALMDAFVAGARGQGCDVVDYGMQATDMIYFAVVRDGLDGGVQITASHNPKQYNGIKMVRKGAQPLSGDEGIGEIRDMVVAKATPPEGAARER